MKTHLVVLLALFVVGSLRTVAAADPPSNPPYLSEMPSVERVLKDMKMDDEHLTLGRRAAALEILAAVIGEMAGPRAARGELTADEQRLVSDYNAAYNTLAKPFDEDLSQNMSFLGLTAMNMNDRFMDVLLQKYFSAEFRAHYAKAVAKPGPLRLRGTYVSDSGLRIDFHPDTATVALGEEREEVNYLVDIVQNKAVVTVLTHNGPAPLTLESDGSFVGADFQSRNAAGQVERRNLGVLKPGAVLTLTANMGPDLDQEASPVEPIADHEFYLLHDSLDDALTKGGFKPAAGMTPRNAMEYARIHQTPEREKALDAMFADLAATSTTDAAGRAQFPPLPPGVYWLVGGVLEPRLAWNLKVELKPGSNAVTIDPYNASPYK